MSDIRTQIIFGGFLWFLSFSAFAQEDNKAPKLINHYLLECPAHLSGISGAVEVEVVVSPQGEVLSSHILRGALELHDESLHVARQLHFEPGIQGGTASEMSVVVTLQFGVHEHEPNHIENEIIIYDSTPDNEASKAQFTMETEAIERTGGIELADVVDSMPGVQQSQTSGAISKPIIRGHQERRMLVLVDGVRHESQKWGADHGTEVDPLSAERISVVRGAAGAQYGPDAIGGVMLVQTPSMRESVGTNSSIRFGGQSNGKRGYGAFRIDTQSELLSQVSFRLDGNWAKGASVHTPEYVLGNTGSLVWNGGISSLYQGFSRQIRFSYHHYDLSAGLFYGMQNESPSDFEAALTRDKPPQADIWEESYEIDRPYQKVNHELISLHWDEELGDWGELELLYAYQHNRRFEFDRVREYVSGPQYDFTLRTHSMNGVLRHHPQSIYGLWLEGGLGVQGTFQENVFIGYSLIPNYRTFSGGIFAFERLSLERGDIDIAIRYDGFRRDVFMHRLDWQRHQRRGTLTDDDCTYQTETEMAQCVDGFSSLSFTAGGITHLIPEMLDLKIDLSTASRFPNIDELYINGTAPSLPVYALGDPTLDEERVYSISTALGIRHRWIEGEISLFGSRIDDYIYFAPLSNDDGSLGYDVTIQGTWPRYAYQSIEANFYGADGRLGFFPQHALGVNIQISTVQAYDQATGEHLISIPADQGALEFVLRVPSTKKIEKMEFSFDVEHVMKQHRVEDALDFAPPPDAYTLLGASYEAKLELSPPIHMGVRASNLLNVSYRDYNSLMRYFAHQPGRDVRMYVRMNW